MIWQRRLPVSQAELWFANLEARFPKRVLWIERPRAAQALIQVVGLSAAAGRQLVADHGGSLRAAPRNRGGAFPPLRIGRRLVIQGTKGTKKAEVPQLVIPADRAFGTGHHATTAMLLRQIATLRGLEIRRVLDIGTGSGILALAARRLGADSVEAWDNDPVCIRVARANEKQNFSRPQIRWRVQALQPKTKAKAPATRFDLVLANLYSEIVIACAGTLRGLVAEGGDLMVSGVLAAHADDVAATLRRSGFEIRRRLRKGKWAAFVARGGA